MQTVYNGFYRTTLTSEEKEEFRRYAQAEGNVISIHDKLLREYIENKRREEAARA